MAPSCVLGTVLRTSYTLAHLITSAEIILGSLFQVLGWVLGMLGSLSSRSFQCNRRPQQANRSPIRAWYCWDALRKGTNFLAGLLSFSRLSFHENTVSHSMDKAKPKPECHLDPVGGIGSALASQRRLETAGVPSLQWTPRPGGSEDSRGVSGLARG